ncbi:MAG: sodium:calcium antiporter, partial [Actinomycetes bacterium]
MVAVVNIALLVCCALAIYFACEWFVNAIEWLGVRLQLGTIAVGSVLAAIGTALPESVVTLVAVTRSDSPESKQIGIGAALGGPLVLSTIAYGVTGWMLFRRRRRLAAEHGKAGITAADPVVADPMAGVDLPRVQRDQKWFLVIFVVKVGLGLVAFAIKPWLGLAFFAAYGVYFVREMRDDAQAHTDADLEPLKLQPSRANPAGWA